MNNLSYINEDLIDLLYESFEITEHEKIKSKSTYEMSFFTGPKISLLNEKLSEVFSKYKKLDSVFKFLLDNNLIDFDRPSTIKTEDTLHGRNEFVLEKTIATKLFIPSEKLKEIHGLNNLIVWISDPDPSTLTDSTIDVFGYTGTFLILIESVYDKGSYLTTLSGCSALNMLVNIANGEKAFKLGATEEYSRGNHKHPVIKLENIGAIPIHTSNIISLYKKRYISDEQCFIYKGKEYRGCDLLGYPLFTCTVS